MRRHLFLVAAMLLLCGAVAGSAQDKPAPPSDPTPVLTTEVRQDFQIRLLEIQNTRLQLERLLLLLEKQKAAVEATHPGYELKIESLTFVKRTPERK